MSFPTPNLLGFSSLGGAMTGITPVGADPLNPLKGQPAVSGIGQFIATIQTTATLRKLGILPPTGKAAAGGALGALGGAGGAGGLQALIAPLLQQFMAMAAGQGAPAPAAAPAATGLNLLA